jgi:hypothetical protein
LIQNQPQILQKKRLGGGWNEHGPWALRVQNCQGLDDFHEILEEVLQGVEEQKIEMKDRAAVATRAMKLTQPKM